jgi:hypothetical protein
LYRGGPTNELVKEMDKYKVYIYICVCVCVCVSLCALQEIRWPGKGTAIKKNYMILYSGHKSDNHDLGTGFYISVHIMDNLLDLEPVNERICKIWVKPKY